VDCKLQVVSKSKRQTTVAREVLFQCEKKKNLSSHAEQFPQKHTTVTKKNMYNKLENDLEPHRLGENTTLTSN
jgi:hypothetical protein